MLFPRHHKCCAQGTSSGAGVHVAGLDTLGLRNMQTPTLKNQLLFAASRAFSSTLTGAFNEVSINTGTTGTVVLTSVTPVDVTVNLQGLTTVKVDAPEGESRCLGRSRLLARVSFS